jgi:hypothetical protein
MAIRSPLDHIVFTGPDAAAMAPSGWEALLPNATQGAIAFLVALGAWFLANFLARPIIQVRDKRFEALRLAERHALTQPPWSQAEEARVSAVKSILLDISTELRTHARGQWWPVRLYCRLAGYNLDEAALAINGLQVMAGSMRFDDSTRMNNLNLVYMYLNAHRHLSADQIAELKRLVAECKQSMPAKERDGEAQFVA